MLGVGRFSSVRRVVKSGWAVVRLVFMRLGGENLPMSVTNTYEPEKTRSIKRPKRAGNVSWFRSVRVLREMCKVA